MTVTCASCGAEFDDEFRTTICPHATFAANDGTNRFAHHPESVLRRPSTTIEIGTILSGRTKRGMVEFQLNGEKTQMDLEKAREVLGMLAGAIEAAVSDELLFAFLTSRIGLSEEVAARALLDFRELRQGSRFAVCPS